MSNEIRNSSAPVAVAPETFSPTKHVSPERQEELLRWWELSLHYTSDDFFFEPIQPYALRKLEAAGLHIAFVEKVLEELRKQLWQCPAQCPRQFRQWCYGRIDTIAAKFARERKQRKNDKPFVYDTVGDNLRVTLCDSEGVSHLWWFPIDYLSTVKRIWPVHLRRFPNGKLYVARKARTFNHDGTWSQRVIPLHVEFVRLNPLFGSGKTYPKNGDYLDWRGDNLQTPASRGQRISEKERERRLKRSIWEASNKQSYLGENGWATVPVNIDPELIEKWERELAQGSPTTTRDILDVDSLRLFSRRLSVIEDLPEQEQDGGELSGIPVPAKPKRLWDGDEDESFFSRN